MKRGQRLPYGRKGKRKVTQSMKTNEVTKPRCCESGSRAAAERRSAFPSRRVSCEIFQRWTVMSMKLYEAQSTRTLCLIFLMTFYIYMIETFFCYCLTSGRKSWQRSVSQAESYANLRIRLLNKYFYFHIDLHDSQRHAFHDFKEFHPAVDPADPARPPIAFYSLH